jgi:hypothetical protein
MDYLVGVKGGSVGYVDGRPANQGYGLWVSYLTSGSLSRTDFDDPTGAVGTSFRYTEVVTGLSGARSLLPYLSVGAALKVARQDVDGFSTSGIFGDASVSFKAYSPDPKTSPYPRIYTSYIARNLEVARWGDAAGGVPVNSEIAIAFDFPGSDLATGVSFYFGDRRRREVRWGVEAALSDEFEIRLGYRRRTGHLSDRANDLPWERGLTGGFSLGFGSIWIDYAFEDASPLDNIHRFVLRSTLAGGE